ncbi:class IV adenylate cyclase [Candidatus Giovannonibacteria bacterium]|nr:class IV adenylate cyclase [Candidatus Giovannonibacteria bacterium]
MRKEIEVKAKIENMQEISKKLVVLGCVLSEPIMQNDKTFVDTDYGEYDKFQPGKNILRIRESNEKFLFTIKQPQSNELDAIEYETEILDPKEFERALGLMGYKSAVVINKTRRKAKFNDFEICLDEVKGLGSFIEVEKITEDENAEKVQNELFGFLKNLGLDEKDRVFHGYDTLVYLLQR